MQLVGASLAGPGTFAVALWGDAGGLATFRTRPGALEELGRLASPRLARANRVHMRGDVAWLPLEQETGAFAAVDLRDLRHPELVVGPVPLAPAAGTCYCLAVHGDRVYVFAAQSATLFVFRWTANAQKANES